MVESGSIGKSQKLKYKKKNGLYLKIIKKWNS